MVAEPNATPLICGCVPGVLAPAAIKTLVGDIVTFDGSLLPKLTVTPPAAAGVGRLTGKESVCPGDTLTPAGRIIDPALTTTTFAVVSAKPAKEVE
jgi:hypothetical protein